LSELLADRAFQLVIEREFEILGEALYRVRNIAPEVFDRIPSGHRIIGMRNILAHGYASFGYAMIFKVR
jgi:uncharacterized protein with HEPN domain